MVELGVSQAQANFTKLLREGAVIVDKKSHMKKAVILPYSEYERLLKGSKKRDQERPFDRFVGALKQDFKTDDERYNRIVL